MSQQLLAVRHCYNNVNRSHQRNSIYLIPLAGYSQTAIKPNSIQLQKCNSGGKRFLRFLPYTLGIHSQIMIPEPSSGHVHIFTFNEQSFYSLALYLSGDGWKMNMSMSKFDLLDHKTFLLLLYFFLLLSFHFASTGFSSKFEIFRRNLKRKKVAKELLEMIFYQRKIARSI